MRVIDSHTGGEPTRVVIEGGPTLNKATIAENAALLRRDFPEFGPSVLCEPRGHDAVVGALLLPATDPTCVTGVIYFNTVNNLGMCGHATIGLAVTLYHMKRISLGIHRFETPVGIVEVILLTPNLVRVVNVESYRHAKDVTINVAPYGTITGDVAYGGNWFFLAHSETIPLEFENITQLTDLCTRIRDTLTHDGITGKDGAEIDHIELNAPTHGNADGRNFVLCPGGAYDRSPCGTGSSAKLACLAEDDQLAPGEKWVQESIIDSTYTLSYDRGETGIIPTIEGSAFVTSEAELLFHPDDQFRTGIRP